VILISWLIGRGNIYINMCTIKSTKAIGKILRVFRVVGDTGRERGVRGRELNNMFI
jgi:hypothetical protein